MSLILFAFSASFWLSVLLLLPVGYFIMLQMASSNTLIQAMVPDALRGRTMAVYSMMFMGMAPIGALLGGAMSDRLGAPWTVAMGGLVSVFGAWWFSLQLPKSPRRSKAADHGAGNDRRRTRGRDDHADCGRLAPCVGALHLRSALRPTAIRKIVLLPRAWGEKKLTTSSSKNVRPEQPNFCAYAPKYSFPPIIPASS